jgi:hypothetical protein
MADFPLADWFDLTKRISREDREVAEAQMALHALKDGLEPTGKEWRQAVAELRDAVRHHNTPFNADHEAEVQAEAALRRAAKDRLGALGATNPKRNAVNRMMRAIKASQ